VPLPQVNPNPIPMADPSPPQSPFQQLGSLQEVQFGEITDHMKDVFDVLASVYWKDKTAYTIHYDLIDAGTVVAPSATVISASDPLVLASVHVGPGGAPAPK